MSTEDSKYFSELDWGRLKGFYYVAKEGNISVAAQFLRIAQPSLSYQISSFEKQLGYPLFSRNLKGVTLTRRGEELFEVVEKIFFSLKEFTYNNKAGKRTSKRKKIRISTTHAIATYIINDLLSEYQDAHPYLTFEIVTHDKLIDIIVNDVDIAIRPFDPAAQGIEQEFLFTVQKKLYASEKYLKEFGKPKTVNDLKFHRIFAPTEREGFPYVDVEWILKLGMPKGKFNKPFFCSTSIESLIREAEKGRGIVGGYEEMSIVKESNLINILPSIKDKIIECYLIYPHFLKKDVEITELNNFLKLKFKS